MTTPDKPENASFKVSGSFEVTDDPFPDKEHEDFFKWVGICIKEWANIEKVLFVICGLILKSDQQHVAIVYYRTPSLEGRLALTDDLVQSIFSKKPGEHNHPLLIIWTKILKEIRDLVPARNILAHSPVRYQISIIAQAVETGDAKIVSEDSWIEIGTSTNEKLKTSIDKSYRVEDLPKHRADVRAISNRLLDFGKNLEQELLSRPSQQNSEHRPD